MKYFNRNIKKSIRFTEEEWTEIERNADACGLKPGPYCRQLILGHKPRQRMTREEMEAINTLGDARADLIRINNVLKKKTEDEKHRLFGNYSFMRAWIDAVAFLINRWKEIIDKFNQI